MDYVSIIKMAEINKYILLNFAFFLSCIQCIAVNCASRLLLRGLCKYTYKRIQHKIRWGWVDEWSIWNNKFRFLL